jgi:hypothetical protein
MGYYLRFISSNDQEITIPLLEKALKSVDRRYSIKNVQKPPGESGDLRFGKETYAHIEINRVGENIFEEELEELKEFVNDSRGRKKNKVFQTLDEARTIVAVQVLWQDRDTEETMRKINPLWSWLLNKREGLWQADDDGYYDSSGLILKE